MSYEWQSRGIIKVDRDIRQFEVYSILSNKFSMKWVSKQDIVNIIWT